jgi:serralysin
MTVFSGTNSGDTANALTNVLVGFVPNDPFPTIDLTDNVNDVFFCNGGPDFVLAGKSNDTISGDAGADTLNGGLGNDKVFGGIDNDILDGGAGNDSIEGGAGSDILKASRGIDTIDNFGARYFSASLDGSNQFPTPVVSSATGSAFMVLNRAHTKLAFSLNTTNLDFDGFQTGTTDDNVTGFHIHAALPGANGPIVWDIKADTDTFVGAAGGVVTSTWTGAALTSNVNALLTGGLYVNVHTNAHSDGEIRGQIGEIAGGTADRIDLKAFNIGSLATFQAITADVGTSARMTTHLNGVTSTTTITDVKESTLHATDFIFAGKVNQTINGTAKADDLFGAGGNDTMNGLGGNDRLFGENDSDKLLGGPGNDQLFGGTGVNTLTGGTGKDTMTGGPVRDTFDFNAVGESVVGANHDIINLFQHGVDKIDLTTIDAEKGGHDDRFTFIGTDPFSHEKGELHFKDLGSQCLVQGDTDGNGLPNFEILVQAATLSKGDFLL